MSEEKKRVERLLEKCRRILEVEKIPVSDRIDGICINYRVRSRFGKCTKTADSYIIELSGKLMEAEDKEIETVILHELLHTCPRCLNHGSRWKAYAERVNQKYGYQITTRTSYEALGLVAPESREKVKYLVVCSKCGMEYPRRRKCSLVENVDRYTCGKCGGKLEIR